MHLMSQFGFLCHLAIIPLLSRCSSGTIYPKPYYDDGAENGFAGLEAFPDPDTPIIDGTIPFDYDDDESNFHTYSHPRKQLVVPAEINWDRPLVELEDICPLTPKAFARLQDDPERLFQKRDTSQAPTARSPSRREQVEPPATMDDLISGVCADVIVIWARGTGNTGNIGSALGRCFFTYLKGNLDYTVIGQGVLPYSANVMGFLKGGCSRGARSMVMMVMLAVEQCPQSKIVLGGFSQGAQVLRKAVERIPASISGNIVAVVSFSDAKEGKPLDGVLKDRHVSFCYDGDWVCDGKNTVVTGKHKSTYYYNHLGAAYDFIESRLVEEGVPVRVHLVWDGIEAEGDSGW